MSCLKLIKFDVSNASYYIEVENGALLRDIAWSWKSSSEVMRSRGKFFREKVREPRNHCQSESHPQTFVNTNQTQTSQIFINYLLDVVFGLSPPIFSTLSTHLLHPVLLISISNNNLILCSTMNTQMRQFNGNLSRSTWLAGPPLTLPHHTSTNTIPPCSSQTEGGEGMPVKKEEWRESTFHDG